MVNRQFAAFTIQVQDLAISTQYIQGIDLSYLTYFVNLDIGRLGSILSVSILCDK